MGQDQERQNRSQQDQQQPQRQQGMDRERQDRQQQQQGGQQRQQGRPDQSEQHRQQQQQGEARHRQPRRGSGPSDPQAQTQSHECARHQILQDHTTTTTPGRFIDLPIQ